MAEKTILEAGYFALSGFAASLVTLVTFSSRYQTKKDAALAQDHHEAIEIERRINNDLKLHNIEETVTRIEKTLGQLTTVKIKK